MELEIDRPLATDQPEGRDGTDGVREQGWGRKLWGGLSGYLDRLLQKTPSSGVTLPELDGVRGFAVFLVLASHANWLHMRGQGAVGVWLFFVLSGFLLTRIMLRKLPASLRFRELLCYVIRRIARIIPTYFTVLLLIAIADRRSPLWLWQHFTFRRADGHFWTIPQEEVFYLLLPLLTAIVFLLRRFLFVPLVLGAGAIGLTLMLIDPPFRIPGNGKMMGFYGHVFAVGFMLAFLLELRPVKRLVNARSFLAVANVAGIVCLAVLLGSAKEQLAAYSAWTGIKLPAEYLGWLYPRSYALVCATLLLSALTRGSLLQRLFSCRVCRAVGVLSFSLYLMHFEILLRLHHDAKIPLGWPLFVLTCVSTLTLAVLVERWIECPSMRFGRRVNERLRSKAHFPHKGGRVRV